VPRICDKVNFKGRVSTGVEDLSSVNAVPLLREQNSILTEIALTLKEQTRLLKK